MYITYVRLYGVEKVGGGAGGDPSQPEQEKERRLLGAHENAFRENHDIFKILRSF